MTKSYIVSAVVTTFVMSIGVTGTSVGADLRSSQGSGVLSQVRVKDFQGPRPCLSKTLEPKSEVVSQKINITDRNVTIHGNKISNVQNITFQFFSVNKDKQRCPTSVREIPNSKQSSSFFGLG